RPDSIICRVIVFASAPSHTLADERTHRRTGGGSFLDAGRNGRGDDTLRGRRSRSADAGVTAVRRGVPGAAPRRARRTPALAEGAGLDRRGAARWRVLLRLSGALSPAHRGRAF